MRVFPSRRDVHRQERRFLRHFFLVMGFLAAVFGVLLLMRLGAR